MYDIDFEIFMKDQLLAHVQVDTKNKVVKVTQFTEDRHIKPFLRPEPTMKDIVDWIRWRCFPETRPNKDQLLADLGLTVYSPLAIIKKTHGIQFDDFYWVKFKGEVLCYDDVKIRD